MPDLPEILLESGFSDSEILYILENDNLRVKKSMAELKAKIKSSLDGHGLKTKALGSDLKVRHHAQDIKVREALKKHSVDFKSKFKEMSSRLKELEGFVKEAQAAKDKKEEQEKAPPKFKFYTGGLVDKLRKSGSWHPSVTGVYKKDKPKKKK